MLFLLLALFGLLIFVLIIAISIRSVRNSADREKAKDAEAIAANYERVQREMPDSKYAQMGPNEFAQAYRDHLRGIRMRSLGLMLLALFGTLFGSPFVLGSNFVESAIFAVFAMIVAMVVRSIFIGFGYPKWPKK